VLGDLVLPRVLLEVRKRTPSTDTVLEEKEGYASELLAYRVVDNLADVIVRRVSDDLDEQDHVLLVSDPEQALGGMPLKEIQGQIIVMREVFKNREQENEQLLNPLRKKPPEADQEEVITAQALIPLITAAAPLVTALGEAAGALPNFLTLFRSEYKVTERDFDVKDPALISSVAGSLARKRIRVTIPNFYFAEGSAILSDLTVLSMQAARLKVQRDGLASMLPKPKEKEEPEKPEDKPPEEPGEEQQKRLAEIAAAVRQTDAALVSFEGFRASWITLPQGQTQSKLEKALVRERINTLGITHLLWLGNLSSGGEATVRNSFPKGDRVGFMGGAAVSFVLADTEGKVLDGNTYAQYGITGGDREDYLGRNPAEVHYPLEYPGGSSDDSEIERASTPNYKRRFRFRFS
jgi:hypothetical protein